MSPPSAQFDLLHKRVYVAGHTGMVGSAIVRRLGSEGCEILISKRPELDQRWSRLSEQIFRVDKWSLCRG